MPHEGFTVQHRLLGRAAAWGAFLVGQAYAIVALLGFLSLESPQDPIDGPWLPIMALLLVLLAPFMVVTMIAVQAYAGPERRAFASTALAFMILLAGITSSVNFAILTVSQHIEAAESAWLPLFLPYRWPALAYSLDVLAWDWFFALAMFFAAPVFRNGRLETTVRILMILSGVLSLVGLMGLPLVGSRALSIGILGYGVAAPVVFLLLALVFGRTQSVPTNNWRERRTLSGT
jgi:hypothetical protein